MGKAACGGVLSFQSTARSALAARQDPGRSAFNACAYRFNSKQENW